MQKKAALKRKLPPPKANLDPDWAWIKRQYRIGMKSTREIARESIAKGRKISHVAIEKRARKEGWARDLKAQVKAKIAEDLARDAVVTTGNQSVNTDVPDDEIIDAAARQGADVIRSHRNDIHRLRSLGAALTDELVAGREVAREFAEVIERGTTPGENATAAEIESLAQRRDRLMKVVGLAGRTTILKDLAQTTRHLIGLERQAFSLNEAEPPDSIEDRLASLGE